jgi:hypothetical protein
MLCPGVQALIANNVCAPVPDNERRLPPSAATPSASAAPPASAAPAPAPGAAEEAAAAE